MRAGVGVDNIDVAAASRRGIVVMNTPGGNTISTAEHTMALLLSLARNVPKANDSLKAGKWERTKFTGTQLEGKTLGVIGLGRVGLAVAKRAQGFGMTVLGFDPFLAADKALEYGVESVVRLDDIWGRCDFLTLHTPMTAETRNLIGPREIALMKPSVRIINCARGGLIDEAALAEALNSGKVAGAAIDVFEPEPPPADHPLVGHPLVVVTPHLGASTEEAQVSVAVEAARLLSDFLTRGQVRFAVNMPALDQGRARRCAALLEPGLAVGNAPLPDGPGNPQERQDHLSRRGRAQEHQADHGQLRRRSDGNGSRTTGQPGQRDPSGPRARNRDRGAVRRRTRRFRHA